jgi:hypothetical protein
LKDLIATEIAMTLSRMTDLETLSKIKKAVDERIAFVRTSANRKPGLKDIVEFKMGGRHIQGRVTRILGRDAFIQESNTQRPFPRVPLESLRVVEPVEQMSA